jgi:hypothetical protein
VLVVGVIFWPFVSDSAIPEFQELSAITVCRGRKSVLVHCFLETLCTKKKFRCDQTLCLGKASMNSKEICLNSET